MAITAEQVRDLREATGAGMMDCKKALDETNGDFEKAVDWLRERGIAKAAKRSGKVAAEGSIYSYIHMGGKIGVLAEVNCETDFVARGEAFQQLCRDICLQICSTNPAAVRREEVDPELVEKEKAVYVAQAKETGKPEAVCVKIAEGKLNKWFSEVCLLEQPFVKDSDKTIQQLLNELTAKCGEKMEVRRFVRFQLGEGIEKQESNFAEEVAAELAKAAARA
jgi:elongation factor Ts